MLLPIDILDTDRNRAALYRAHRFIVIRIGTQGLTDLELVNPLDTDIDLLTALRDCRDAIIEFYDDGSICDPRARPGGDPALDIIADQIKAAIADEEDHQWRLEQEDRYLAGLYDSWSRYCEAYPR